MENLNKVKIKAEFSYTIINFAIYVKNVCILGKYMLK